MLKKIVVSSYLAAFTFVGALQAQADGSRIARLIEIAVSHTKDDAFMGTVLVTSGKAVLLNKGFGRAVVEWDNANVPDVKFRLGSITK